MNNTPRCSYGQSLCTPESPCAYCERNALRKLLREALEVMEWVEDLDESLMGTVGRKMNLKAQTLAPKVREAIK